MVASGQIYKGYLIWRDAQCWVLRLETEGIKRFGTLKSAKVFAEQNPRTNSPQAR